MISIRPLLNLSYIQPLNQYNGGNVFLLFIVMLFIFYFIAFITIFLVNNSKTKRIKSQLKPPTPKIQDYIQYVKTIKPEFISPQATRTKYTIKPIAKLKRKVGDLDEVAVPRVFNKSEKLKVYRKNRIIFTILMVIWVSLFLSVGLRLVIMVWQLVVFIMLGGISYWGILMIYTRWYDPAISFIESVEFATKKTIEPNELQFQPLDEVDVLYGWLLFQKRKATGLFKDIPPFQDIKIQEIKQAIFAEAEAEAEYYTIGHFESHKPYSLAEILNFYADPFPVRFPTTFEDSFQDFPCDSTLEKRICHRCNGSGRVTCSRCHGRGKVKCSRCHGRGYTTSTRTTRDGKRVKVRHSCSCFGGKRTCTRCVGSGNVECSTCRGEGFLGHYIVRRYSFKHWKEMKVFKETNNRIQSTHDITDLPNQDSRLIYLRNKDEIGLTFPNPNFSPSIRSETIKLLEQTQRELEAQICRFENVIFDQYAFREFPEFQMEIKINAKPYILQARGYKPLEKKYTKFPSLPISYKRITFLMLPFLISVITLVVLIFNRS